MGVIGDCVRRRATRGNTGNVLFLLGMGVIMVYYGQTWPDEQRSDTISEPSNVQTHVIISSYIKGGSSVIGDILGRHENTFYSFEPLFARSMWNYYRSNTTACKILENLCFEVDSGTVQTALDMVASNYFCKTAAMIDKYYHPRWDNGGPPWRLFHQCMEEGKDAVDCNQILDTSCTHAPNRVVKVNRLSVRLLGELLKGNNNLKIIHVFRDPRGIIASKMKMSHNPILPSPDVLRTNAEALCQRMEDDLVQGTKLLQLYPDRFKIILFEDLLANIDYAYRQLLRFLNVRYTNQDRDSIATVMNSDKARQYADEASLTVAELSGKSEDVSTTAVNPFQWRESLDINTVRIIDAACGGLYKRLGYNTYDNEDKLKDLAAWPGFGDGGIPPL